MTREEFEAKAIIPLALLEELAGIERRQLRRHLESNSVPLKRSGNRYVLHRVALRRALPDLYEAILEKLAGPGADPGLGCYSYSEEADGLLGPVDNAEEEWT